MILEKLTHNSLFANVEEPYLQLMVSSRTEVNLDKGEFLFHQGEMGKGMYILLEGEVEVVLEEKGEVLKVVAVLEPGHFLGEVCMLAPQPRTAGVRAKTPTKLLYLGTEEFLNHIDDKDPNALQISHNIGLTLSKRLKRANEIVMTLSISSSSGLEDIEREVAKYREKLLTEALF